jgi:hypothetical protein
MAKASGTDSSNTTERTGTRWLAGLTMLWSALR